MEYIRRPQTVLVVSKYNVKKVKVYEYILGSVFCKTTLPAHSFINAHVISENIYIKKKNLLIYFISSNEIFFYGFSLINPAITHIFFIRMVSQAWSTFCLLSHRALLELLCLSFKPLQWLWPLECVRERRGEGECCVQQSYESIQESECVPRLSEWQWARPENGCMGERQRNGFSLSQHFVPNGEGGEG